MEQDSNRRPQSSEPSGISPEMASRAGNPQMSFRRKIGRLLFRRGGSPEPREDAHGSRLEEREAAIYTLDDFTKEQFFRVVAHFAAWYEVAKNPSTAASHPLVVERFQGTLDPDDVQEIFAWWEEGLDELLDALESTRDLLGGDTKLADPPMEKVLSIMFHANGCVDSLLRELDQSRYEDA